MNSPYKIIRPPTRRDVFAAQAMQALLGRPHTHVLSSDDIARAAVAHADALIAELEKGKEEK